MWSLANEFWYYALFPLIVLPFFSRSIVTSLSSLLGLAVLIIWLPRSILFSGLIWFAAAAARIVLSPRLHRLDKRLQTPLGVLAIVTIFMLLALSLHPHIHLDEMTLGITFALTLPLLVCLPSFGLLYERPARAISEISFSLYVSHFPLLMMLTMLSFAPERFQPGVIAFLVFAGFICAALAWATLFWFLFERHTDRVFRFLLKRISERRSSRAEAPVEDETS